ncbi:MAG TPA: hypothetical protein VH373_14350 [Jatrophihabitantaceae bacterium]|jgi:hypothetical protein
MTWPKADLDAVRRLHVLAAAVPGAVTAEALLPAPFDQVWAVAADLEGELPQYLPDVRSLRLTRVAGEQLEADARGYAGLRAHFDIVLRPGWCVMRSRFLLGAMAAVAEGDHTRFAFLTGAQLPGQRLVGPALGVLGRWAAPRVVARVGERVARRG